jgi:hypothetical protein
MQKPCKLLIILLLVISLISGCTSKQTPQNSDAPSADNTGNPFDVKDEDNPFQSLGSIGHGLRELTLDENGARKPLEYSGGEMEVKYQANATGKGKNVGFLVFVDGVPQPYKIDSTDAPYEYMHFFVLPEDNADVPFSFIFSPVKGKTGDILPVTVLSVYYPGFQPDMTDTVSFGSFHAILPFNFKLTFKQDADISSEMPTTIGAITKSTQRHEPVTNDLLKLLSTGIDVTPEYFDNNVFQLIYYNGESFLTDNLKVTKDGRLNVTYKLCGTAGVNYKTTFYVNHQPIGGNDGIVVDTSIKKGEITVTELAIDLSKLPDFSTFYAVSVPTNAGNSPDANVGVIKTPSMLLYK